MDENVLKNIQEIIDSLSETWKGALISAGITAGIYNALNPNVSISVNDLAKKLKFDPVKLDNWLYFMDSAGYVLKNNDGYKLTEKGCLLTDNTQSKDLAGLLQLTNFYMEAAVQAKETFKSNDSLDKISDGKITRDYQPKVSDNFSLALIGILQKYNVSTTDTLLDIGCGSGTFLRKIASSIPDIKLTGMEANLFVIEKGKKLDADLGVSDRINLLVGDITEDLESIPSDSYDWVTAINVFHFIPENRRMYMLENMLRISRKGIMATETICEASPVAGAANVLMFLLWNDFTGFFRKNNLDAFHENLMEKYKNYKFEINDIMHGKSTLLTILKN